VRLLVFDNCEHVRDRRSRPGASRSSRSTATVRILALARRVGIPDEHCGCAPRWTWAGIESAAWICSSIAPVASLPGSRGHH